MKEFAVAYILRGKRSFGRFEAKNGKEAAKILTDAFPDIKILGTYEVDDNMKKLLDVVKPLKDKELDDIKKEIAAAKADRENADYIEKRRKSKFIKYQDTQVPQLSDDKKKILIDTADKLFNMGKDFDRRLWNKLLDQFLDSNGKKEMQKEFEEDAKAHWKNDKANLDRELEVIRRIFGDTKGKWGGDTEATGALTFDQIATKWGTSKPYAVAVYKKGLGKIVSKLLNKDVASKEDIKQIQDKINDINSKMRKLNKAKQDAATKKTAGELEKQAIRTEREFKQLLKDLNDVRKAYDLPALDWKVRYHPKDVSLDAFEKPIV